MNFGEAQSPGQLTMNTFLYFFCAACWGLSYLAINLTIQVLPPLLGAASRLTIASIFLTFCMVITRGSFRISFQDFLKIAFLGLLLQAAPFALLFWGEKHVAPALAGVLVAGVPILVVLFSFVFKHEQEGIFLKSLGVSIGFLGILVIFSPQLRLKDLSVTGGVLAIFGTSCCYALGNIFLKKWQRGIDRWANITLQGVISATILFVFAFMVEPIPPLKIITRHPEVFVALGYLGIFSSGLAWIAAFHLIDQLGSIRYSTICYPMALVSILADMVYFGTFPPWTTFLGTLLILLGVFVVQFTPIIVHRLKTWNW